LRLLLRWTRAFEKDLWLDAQAAPLPRTVDASA